MSNDFINRRQIDDRRRRRGSSGGTPLTELIVLANVDTFIHWDQDTADRWQTLIEFPDTNFVANQAWEVPIGLMNPWNDADSTLYPPPSGQLGTQIRTRSPTRAVMGFDLTQLPANASVVDAKLVTTVARNYFWNIGDFPPAGNNPLPSGGGGNNPVPTD